MLEPAAGAVDAQCLLWTQARQLVLTQSSTACSRCCRGMPAWPSSLGDGFVSHGVTESATTGMWSGQGSNQPPTA